MSARGRARAFFVACLALAVALSWAGKQAAASGGFGGGGGSLQVAYNLGAGITTGANGPVTVTDSGSTIAFVATGTSSGAAANLASLAVVTKTVSTSGNITSSAYLWIVNSASATTQTLPDGTAAGLPGLVVAVKNIGAGVVTVQGVTTAQLIWNASAVVSITLNQGDSFTLVFDNVTGNWMVVS